MSVSVSSSKKLLNLTQAMLVAAEAGNWGEVAKFETRRQAILRKLEATINSTDIETSRDAIANDLREVLSINTRVLVLGEQVRSELAGSMSGLRQGRKAVDAYYGMK